MTTPRLIPVGDELPGPAPSAFIPRSGGESMARRPRPRGDARKSAADRFATLNAFVDGGMAGLSRAELACWLVLYRDVRRGEARTGRADLARRAGCDLSTVTRALASLQRRGLIELRSRGGIGRGVSVYRVFPPPGSKGAPTHR